MEHVHPFSSTSPRRATGIAAGFLLAVVLLVGGGLALAQREHGPRPLRETGPIGKATPPTPLRPRSRISVAVLNGNGLEGAAGTAATKLLGAGYRHAIPGDAVNSGYPRSLVLFRPGWQREAERLGRDARIATVAPLDGRVARAYAHVPLILILGAN